MIRSGTLTALILLSLSGQAQQVRHARYYRETIILSDTVNGYYGKTEVQSENNAPDSRYIIPFSDTRSVTGCKVSFYNEDGKLKKYRDANLHDRMHPGNYFLSSQCYKSCSLPEKGAFRIVYETYSKDLILFSGFNFMDQYPIDTFYYVLKVPGSLHISYSLINPDNLRYFSIDSMEIKGDWTYLITGCPNRSVPDDSRDNPFNIRGRDPSMLMIAVPSSYKGKESWYLNRWFRSRMSAPMTLGREGERIADSLARGLEDKDSIINRMFIYVRDHVHYLQIDTGFSGIIPAPACEVIKSRQGDCKAMANLLACMLKHTGLDARIGIIGADDCEKDFSFPSIACGNHMICVTIVDGKTRFLDPTNRFSGGILPGGMIEGRTVFVLGPDFPQYLKIPVSDPYFNREKCTILLSSRDGNLSGSVTGCYHGESMENIRGTLSQASGVNRSAFMKTIVQDAITSSSISGLEFHEGNDSCCYTGKISLGRQILFRAGDLTCLNPGFLPPTLAQIRETHFNGDILFTHSIHKTVNLVLDPGYEVHDCSLKNVEIREGGFFFSMKSEVTEKKLRITYQLIFHGIDYPYEKRAELISFLKKLEKIFGNVISIS